MTLKTIQLEAALKSFNTPHTFVQGDIVDWKPGLANKSAQTPLIVVEVLDTPILDLSNDPGSPYFREPLNLILGYISNDNEFVCHHYDSRRMQPYSEPEA